MFKSWGTWLGIESIPGDKADGVQAEDSCGSDTNSEENAVNKHECSDNTGENQPILQQAKGLSGELAFPFYFHTHTLYLSFV